MAGNTFGGSRLSPFQKCIKGVHDEKHDILEMQSIMVVLGLSMVLTGCPADQQAISGVTVYPAVVTLERGEIQDFAATVLGTNDPPQSVM